MVTRDFRQPRGTKLVSFLYFPFISNKRQVKRGNCHTLISSGDLCLVACNFRLTILRYLAPIVRQFVKFRDMPELKRKHRCTIREVPKHSVSQKGDDYVICKVP